MEDGGNRHKRCKLLTRYDETGNKEREAHEYADELIYCPVPLFTISRVACIPKYYFRSGVGFRYSHPTESAPAALGGVNPLSEFPMVFGRTHHTVTFNDLKMRRETQRIESVSRFFCESANLLGLLVTHRRSSAARTCQSNRNRCLHLCFAAICFAWSMTCCSFWSVSVRWPQLAR